MANYFYETDDETGIYLEDDSTFEELVVPSPIVVPDTEELVPDTEDPVLDPEGLVPDTEEIVTSLPVEDPITVPMEDPIVDTNPFQGDDDVVKKEQIDRQTESMMKLSMIIKKWWICWFVSFVVAAAIFGTIYLLLSEGDKATAANNSSSQSDSGVFDIKTTMSPTSSPSIFPSNSPSATPTFQPPGATAGGNGVNKPTTTTTKPTVAPVTSKPTNTPTTLAPSSSPSTDQYARIIPLLKSVSRNPEFLDDVTSWNYIAADWVKNNSTISLVDDVKIIQRYVAVLLDLSLHGSFALSLPSVDECLWLGITCNNDNKFSAITSILWNEQGMTGRIPNDISLLSALQTLDLSDNDLIGIIPNGLYECSQLQYLYLYGNQLRGSLSTWIGTLSNLVHLYLGQNALTGSLPSELGGYVDNFGTAKPLEWLSLFDNQFSGSLPSNLGWSNMIYLDFGKNQFSGAIPSDWVDGDATMINLKSLYLDYNHFNGSLPQQWFSLGNGTIEQIVINDNWLTGEISSTKGGNPNSVSNVLTNLTVFEIQNNAFTRFDKDICKQSIHSGVGWLAIFNADCDMCQCSELCPDTSQCAV